MSEESLSGGHPALTDDESGLPNQLHFDTVFRVVFHTGRRGVPLAVLILEIRDFQAWKARTQPDEQARVLRILGAALRPVVRGSDLLSRSGEDRFAVGLLDCNVAGAILVADRIEHVLDPIKETTGLAFNIGGAVFDMDMREPKDLFAASEDALKAARTKGANKIEFYR